MKPPIALPQVFFIPTILTPLGNGEFRASQGKPIEWLSAKQLAGEFGVDRDSIYRWRSEGTIPKTHVKPGGKRAWRFHASVIPILKEAFARLKDAANPGAMDNLKRR